MSLLTKQEDFFCGRGDTVIFYRAYLPYKAKTRASYPVVIMVHGWGEHSGRYENFCEYMASKGNIVYTIDLRGHGYSAGQRGHIDHWDDYLYDIYILTDIIQERHKSSKMVLMGHSMGGLTAVSYAMKFPQTKLASLVLCSPALGVTLKVNPVKIVAGNLMSSILPRLSLTNKISIDALTKNPTRAANLSADPLLHRKVSARWYTEFNRVIDGVMRDANIFEMPVFLLHSEGDQVTSCLMSQEFYNSLPSVTKKIYIHQGNEHNLLDIVEYGKIYKFIVDWIKKV